MSQTIRIIRDRDIDGASCAINSWSRDPRKAQSAARKAARDIKAYRPSDADAVSTLLNMKTTD